MLRRFPTAVVIAVLALAAQPSAGRADSCCGGAERDWRPCEIVPPIGDALTVRMLPDTTPVSIAFGRAGLRGVAMRLRQKGSALIETHEDQGIRTVTALGVRASRTVRVGFFLSTAIILWLIVALLSRGRAHQVALGHDNRYSGSTFQTVVWFATLIVCYLSTLAVRGWAGGPLYAGGVAIPQKLLVLAGFSAVTFVAARALTQAKVDRAESLAREQPAMAGSRGIKTRATRPSFPLDLVSDDQGHIDFGSLQMIVVTLIAVIVYGIRVLTCLGHIELGCSTSLPDVDTVLLGGLAVGQGAYLAKKAASRLGEG